jgi:predicted transposase/invertase (TIGR01784 family)
LKGNKTRSKVYVSAGRGLTPRFANKNFALPCFINSALTPMKESNRYDKIFKENIEAVTMVLVEKVLGIQVRDSERLPYELPVTLERKPDQLLKITDHNNETFILHLEFQVADEKEMAERMLEYWVLLHRKYKLPIRQYVFYLSEGTPKMATQLKADNVQYHFDLISIAQVDHQKFLSSNKPEEIIFAVLGNIGDEKPEKVALEVVTQLQRFSPNQLTFQKHLQQLRILINLRKLKPFITSIMESITQYIKPEDDYFYKKGIEEGVEKGVEKDKQEVIIRLLRKTSFSNEQIAEIVNVPVDLVERIKKEQGQSK